MGSSDRAATDAMDAAKVRLTRAAEAALRGDADEAEVSAALDAVQRARAELTRQGEA